MFVNEKGCAAVKKDLFISATSGFYAIPNSVNQISAIYPRI